MPSTKSSTIDTGLPLIPETQDRTLFYELTKLYNAIGILQLTLDQYTAGGSIEGSLSSKANDAEVMHILGPKVTEGSNAKQGIGTLVAGTLVVNNTSITAVSRIFLTSQIDGGTPGFLRVASRVVGTSFTVKSSNVLDTSTFAYVIFEPA